MALTAALEMPSGARWLRCVLQVNPYDYLLREGRPDAFADELTYNKALVAALVTAEVDVIAITDHFCVRSSEGLAAAAGTAGITVFPGFEAKSKEGVHLLVLFNPGTSVAAVEQRIAECGVSPAAGSSEAGNLLLEELLERLPNWGATAVAPHVTTDGGLLTLQPSTGRMSAWSLRDLHAVAVARAPGQEHQSILGNSDVNYRREFAVAVLHACDVSRPADVAHAYASTWIKLSSLTTAALDLAFRSPDTRIRTSQPQAAEHPRITAVAWEGGFLDEVGLHLSSDLNVLIGGRGTGKSTVVESIRFALGLAPLTDRGRGQHEQTINQVLRSGTKVSLSVECSAPAPRTYRIERLVGHSPIVYDDGGNALASTPSDVIPGVVVFGQRELADVADRPEYQVDLLVRRMAFDISLDTADDLRHVGRARKRVLELIEVKEDLEASKVRLGVVEEQLLAFEQAGVRAKLQAQALQKQEERVLRAAQARAADAEQLAEAVRTGTQDTAFTSGGALKDLPHRELLGRIGDALGDLNAVIATAAADVASAVMAYRERVAVISQEWATLDAPIAAELEKALRDLQVKGVDGTRYLELEADREQLRAAVDRLPDVERQLVSLRAERAALVAGVHDKVAARNRALQREAKKVSKRTAPYVRVSVDHVPDIDRMVEVIAAVDGRMSETRDALKAKRPTPDQVVSAARKGADAVQQLLGVPTAQATRLADMEEDLLLELEELQHRDQPTIELNVGTDQAPVWRRLEHLSTGQKATALLVLLLVDDAAPLIIDQPEDDLDNGFIYDGVVPRMRASKGKRQLIVSSHNANIPVLGDAELILAMEAQSSGGDTVGTLRASRCGALDDQGIREVVEDLLEGGREAFQARRYRYGF